MVLVFGVVAYIVVLMVMLATSNLNLFPTLLFLGAVTVPLSVLLLVYATSPMARGRAGLVAVTAIAGGVIGTTTAGLLEYTTLKALPWLGMLAVGVIEETAKMVVPLFVLIALRRRAAGLGVVLGIASGAGFAVLETMGYGLTALISSRGNLAAVDVTLLLRALLAPAGHVAWSGLTCAALWRAADRSGHRHRLLGLVGAWVAAVALHTIWDASTSTIPHVVTAAASLLILVLLIVRGARLGHPSAPPPVARP